MSRRQTTSHGLGRALGVALALGVGVALAPVAARAEAAPPEAGGGAERAGRVVFDLLVLRPLDAVTTAISLTAAVVAYPVALPFGGEDQVVDYLIRSPLQRTFRRPLGEL